MRARTWVFVLVGAILIGFTSILFATTRHPEGWSGLVESLVVGGSVGAILGLVVARRLSLVTFIAVIVAVVLAASGTFVILDSRANNDCQDSPKSDSCPGDWQDPGLVAVVVVTQDVQTGQEMDSLIEDDLLKQIEVPLATLARGATTDVSQLKGKTATRPIRKDEQISLEYLR